jgi:large subunit ribosomal protein L6
MSSDVQRPPEFENRAGISLPPQVTARVDGATIVVQGPNGQIQRTFPTGGLEASTDAKEVTLALRTPARRRRSRALLHTWRRHVENMVLGVTQGFEARMKIVAAHFPMKVQVRDHGLVIENFLGEKHPRTAPILDGVQAHVEGEFVVLSGPDVERVGQTVANIERTTHIRAYDPRVFQDGIYLVERAHPKEGAT